MFRHMSEKYMSKSAQLCTTTLHATVCSILSFYYLYTHDYSVIHYIRHWSIAYFAYDTYWQVKNRSLLFAGHHIASILVFTYLLPTSVTDIDGNLMMIGIWAGEVGNFTVYRVNYKIYKSQPLTNFDLVLETFAFLVWRNLIGLFMMAFLRDHLYRFCVVCFWSVSIWWGFGVMRQLYRKIVRDIDEIRLNR
jgi:hypothetical protein